MRRLSLLALTYALCVSTAAQAQLLTMGAGRPPRPTCTSTTLDASNTASGITLSSGNLVATGISSSYGSTRSTGGAALGTKTHFEGTLITSGGTAKQSFGAAASTKDVGPGANSWIGGSGSIGTYETGNYYTTLAGPTATPALVLTAGQTYAGEVDYTTTSPTFCVWNASTGGAKSCATFPGLATPVHAYFGFEGPGVVWSFNDGRCSAFVATPTSGFTDLLQ